MTTSIELTRTGANKLVRDILDDVLSRGVEFKTGPNSMFKGNVLKERMNLVAQITNPRDRLVRSSDFPQILNPGLAVSRFFYMLSGSRLLKDINFYTEGVAQFSDDGNVLGGSAVGARIFSGSTENNQFEASIRLINERQNTKRAAISVYQATDCGCESRDIPCCMGMVFSPRDGSLDMTIFMRANNALRLLSYNIFEFSLFGEFLNSYTSLEFRKYYHIAVSMHIAITDVDLAKHVVREDLDVEVMPIMPQSDSALRGRLIEEEKLIRECATERKVNKMLQLINRISDEYHRYWVDLLVCLAGHALYRTAGVSAEEDFLSESGTYERPVSGLLQNYIEKSKNIKL